MRRVMHKPLPLTAEEWAEINALPAEAIGLVRKTDHGFHAVVAYAKRPGVLNSATRGYLSDPDFSPSGYGATREETAQRLADAVRADLRGVGKYAPHWEASDVIRLLKCWRSRARALGRARNWKSGVPDESQRPSP